MSKRQVICAPLARRRCSQDEFPTTGTYVAVAAEVLQQLNFTQRALGENLFAKDIGHLFDGDALVCLVVDGSTTGRLVSVPRSLAIRVKRASAGRGAEEKLTRRCRRRPGPALW